MSFYSPLTSHAQKSSTGESGQNRVEEVPTLGRTTPSSMSSPAEEPKSGHLPDHPKPGVSVSPLSELVDFLVLSNTDPRSYPSRVLSRLVLSSEIPINLSCLVTFGDSRKYEEIGGLIKRI